MKPEKPVLNKCSLPAVGQPGQLAGRVWGKGRTTSLLEEGRMSVKGSLGGMEYIIHTSQIGKSIKFNLRG